jgi:hypothetical protein
MGILRRGCLGAAALCVSLAAAAGEWDVRFDGVGPLTVGMRFDEANALLHGALAIDPGSSRECYYARAAGHPQLALMFTGDVLWRVDAVEGTASTASGIALGDPVRRVFRVYPKASAQRHAYDERERYYTVHSADGKLALRFETHEGRVATFYAGRWKEVQYIEGCL